MFEDPKPSNREGDEDEDDDNDDERSDDDSDDSQEDNSSPEDESPEDEADEVCLQPALFPMAHAKGYTQGTSRSNVIIRLRYLPDGEALTFPEGITNIEY